MKNTVVLLLPYFMQCFPNQWWRKENKSHQIKQAKIELLGRMSLFTHETEIELKCYYSIETATYHVNATVFISYSQTLFVLNQWLAKDHLHMIKAKCLTLSCRGMQ